MGAFRRAGSTISFVGVSKRTRADGAIGGPLDSRLETYAFFGFSWLDLGRNVRPGPIVDGIERFSARSASTPTM